MKSIYRQILTTGMMVLISHSSVAQFDGTLNLSDLNGGNGFKIYGIDRFEESGQSVSYAGDVNGDGIDDLIIGARFSSPNGNYTAGRSYVVFGNTDGFSSILELSSLDGINGFSINGVSEGHVIGRSVSHAGDVNNDGIDDVIIGAPQIERSYVVFGDSDGFSSSVELSTLDGNNGFTLNGEGFSGDNTGYSVSYAGDVNGDRIDDVIIGAWGGDPNNNAQAGNSFIVFGNPEGFPSSLELSSLNGMNGFTINGESTNDYSGYSVSYAGDVNGDGIDDMIIGARRADPNGNSSAGSSYVVFGDSDGFPSSLNLSSLNGANGFTIKGVADNDYSGRSVSYAGDVNGDGIDDVIIGANGADPNGNSFSGSSYVVFGSEDSIQSSLDLSSLNGINGFTINGIETNEFSGTSVSYAGDINGDGIDDIIIGSFRANANGNEAAGSSYVVFGSEDGFTSNFDLSSLNGSNGFSILGEEAFDESGRSVSYAGDVNGDGIDDVIIGAHRADPNDNSQAGISYVVFGREKPLFINGFE